MEGVKKLQKTPLSVKKNANSGILDAFFALIGAFFILFPTVPVLCKTLYYLFLTSKASRMPSPKKLNAFA